MIDDNDDDERRRAPRSDIQDTLFIKSIASSQITAFNEGDKTLNTINASATGLQAILDFEVLVDSEIALWINHAADSERCLVSGEVRWVKKTVGGDKYLVGIALDCECIPAMTSWLQRHPS